MWICISENMNFLMIQKIIITFNHKSISKRHQMSQYGQNITYLCRRHAIWRMRRLHYSCHKLTDASLTNYLYICSTSGNNANIENNTYFSWQSTELGIIFSLSNAPVGDINTKRKWWIIFIRVSNWDCIIQNEKNPFYYKDLCGTVANYLKKNSVYIFKLFERISKCSQE